MQRRSISCSEHQTILEHLVVSRTHSDVMSMVCGRHDLYGRVVLLQSGTSYVVIADDLEPLNKPPQMKVGQSAVFSVR